MVTKEEHAIPWNAFGPVTCELVNPWNAYALSGLAGCICSHFRLAVSGVDTKMWALLRSQGANSVSCHMLDLILISHAMSRLQNKSWAL